MAHLNGRDHRLVRFIVRRALWASVTILAVTFLAFVVFYLAPAGDPALARAGRHPTPELVTQIRRSLALDRSWLHQYAHFLNRLVLHLDLGRSFVNDVPVRQEILARLPVSAYLAGGAAVLSVAAGISVGAYSAARMGSGLDHVFTAMEVVAISAPPYWLALVLLYLLSSDGQGLHLFPGQGACIEFHPVNCAPAFVLPWLALAVGLGAFYSRLTRSSLMETMGEPYVRCARAQGMSEGRVVLRHGLRPTLAPLVSSLGVDVAGLLGGSLLIETVFNLPGVGRYAFQAIQQSDLPAIQGTVLFGALTVVVANMIVDILYAVLDPRVVATRSP